jgi:hypothetical protein
MKRATTFTVQPHSIVPDAQVVEVWRDSEFLATITANDDGGLRVTSRWLTGAKHRATGVAEVSFDARI